MSGATSTYGGESLQKKVARVLFWAKVSFLLGRPLSTCRILCLAGPAAADARHLIAVHSVPAGNITLIDRDPACIAAAKRLVPGAHIVEGDLSKPGAAQRLLKQQRWCFDVMFIDLCNYPTPSSVALVARTAAWGLRSGGVLAAGFSAARERTHDQRRRLDEARARLGQMAMIEGGLARITKQGTVAKAWLRSLIVLQLFAEVLPRFNLSLLIGDPLGISYTSRKPLVPAGTPMLYLMGILHRGHRTPLLYDDAGAQIGVQSLAHEAEDEVREFVVALWRECGLQVAADAMAMSDAEAKSIPAWAAWATRRGDGISSVKTAAASLVARSREMNAAGVPAGPFLATTNPDDAVNPPVIAASPQILHKRDMARRPASLEFATNCNLAFNGRKAG